MLVILSANETLRNSTKSILPYSCLALACVNVPVEEGFNLFCSTLPSFAFQAADCAEALPVNQLQSEGLGRSPQAGEPRALHWPSALRGPTRS